MAIQILCPGCKKRFQVSDQFAGKTGPCPNCKTLIKIPEPTGEVKVHEPEIHGAGGRGMSGKLILKPITRKDARFSWKAALGIAAAVLAVFGGAVFARDAIAGVTAIWWAALVLVSPPLAVASYSFLYNDELEPYRGRWLWIRAAAVAAVYVALWGVLTYVLQTYYTGELWNWLLFVPPLFVVGALAAHAALDLDFGNGLFHYAFCIMATIVLHWAGGMGWIWNQPPAL
jgi:hypothetical protein